MAKKDKDNATQKAFRFCQVTVDNIKELVELGIVRNETEAIDMSVMHFLTERKTEARFRRTKVAENDAPTGRITEIGDLLSCRPENRDALA